MINRIKEAIRWRWQRFIGDTLFDLLHGLKTSLVETSYLDKLQSPNRQYMETYQASRWSLFRKMVAALPIDHRDFTFVDAGCGKGRALIFSSRFHFKRAVGIEISADLLSTAHWNIQKYFGNNKLYNIELVNSDVTTYELPHEPLVVFLYNPFNGLIMSRFIENLACQAAQSNQPVYIVYMVPWCKELIERQGSFELFTTVSGSCIYRYVGLKTVENFNVNELVPKVA